MNQIISEFNERILEKYDEGFSVLNLIHMYRRSQLLRTLSGVSTKHYTSYNQKDGIIIPKDTDNKMSTSATKIIMKFLSTIYFLRFLLLSATTPTLNGMKRKSNGLNNRKICYLVFAISIEPLKKRRDGIYTNTVF